MRKAVFAALLVLLLAWLPALADTPYTINGFTVSIPEGMEVFLKDSQGQPGFHENSVGLTQEMIEATFAADARMRLYAASAHPLYEVVIMTEEAAMGGLGFSDVLPAAAESLGAIMMQGFEQRLAMFSGVSADKSDLGVKTHPQTQFYGFQIGGEVQGLKSYVRLWSTMEQERIYAVMLRTYTDPPSQELCELLDGIVEHSAFESLPPMTEKSWPSHYQTLSRQEEGIQMYFSLPLHWKKSEGMLEGSLWDIQVDGMEGTLLYGVNDIWSRSSNLFKAKYGYDRRNCDLTGEELLALQYSPSKTPDITSREVMQVQGLSYMFGGSQNVVGDTVPGGSYTLTKSNLDVACCIDGVTYNYFFSTILPADALKQFVLEVLETAEYSSPQ